MSLKYEPASEPQESLEKDQRITWELEDNTTVYEP